MIPTTLTLVKKFNTNKPLTSEALPYGHLEGTYGGVMEESYRPAQVGNSISDLPTRPDIWTAQVGSSPNAQVPK